MRYKTNFTILLLLLLAACVSKVNQESVAKQGSNSSTQLESLGMSRWVNSCALCHIRGEGGAPRMGNAEEWQPRLEQGMSVLLKHTLEGFNNMPPLGYCMSCEADDFVRMIHFMSKER